MMKLTKKEMFTRILAQLENAEDRAFIEHEIELIDRKRSNSKVTATQKANEVLKEAIINHMIPEQKYTVEDIMLDVPELVAIKASSQKVAALMGQLVKAGTVYKFTEKRKTIYVYE